MQDRKVKKMPKYTSPIAQVYVGLAPLNTKEPLFCFVSYDLLLPGSRSWAKTDCSRSATILQVKNKNVCWVVRLCVPNSEEGTGS